MEGEAPAIQDALKYYNLNTKDFEGGLNIVDRWNHLVEKTIDAETYRVRIRGKLNIAWSLILTRGPRTV